MCKNFDEINKNLNVSSWFHSLSVRMNFKSKISNIFISIFFSQFLHLNISIQVNCVKNIKSLNFKVRLRVFHYAPGKHSGWIKSQYLEVFFDFITNRIFYLYLIACVQDSFRKNMCNQNQFQENKLHALLQIGTSFDLNSTICLNDRKQQI